MIFWCWSRPSQQKQKNCIERSNNVFGYDDKYKGATTKPASTLKQDKELSASGFTLDHERFLVGSGLDTFMRGKNALKNWRHISVKGTFVDPDFPIHTGAAYCVCLKVIFGWTLMPVEIVSVDESSRSSDDATASFSFAAGGLKGSIGEERFSITMDEENKVWYEILSISKPANVLVRIVCPYMRITKKRFACESASQMKKLLSP